VTSKESGQLLAKLGGGDRRSIGQANDVVQEVLRAPHLLPILIDGLTHGDPLIRMRSADVLEKVTARHPAWLAPHKHELLKLLSVAKQKEIRWHLAQMIPRLALADAERADAISVLKSYLTDPSSIVKTNAMQAVAELGADDERFRSETVRLLKQLVRSGTPAMRARGRTLLGSTHPERKQDE